jgi:hypothetical protein
MEEDAERKLDRVCHINLGKALENPTYPAPTHRLQWLCSTSDRPRHASGEDREKPRGHVYRGWNGVFLRYIRSASDREAPTSMGTCNEVNASPQATVNNKITLDRSSIPQSVHSSEMARVHIFYGNLHDSA